MPTALITGVTGQDGAYLARFLLAKSYTVHGVKRRSSMFNTQRVDGIYTDPHEARSRFFLHYGDLTDGTNLIRIIQETQPDEIYNLGAQSHVQVSFETPEYTANSDALGTLRLLEALRILGMTKRVASIKHPPPNFTEERKRSLRLSELHFTLVRPTAWRSCTHTGLPSITARHTESMPRTGFCLITNPRSAARLS